MDIPSTEKDEGRVHVDPEQPESNLPLFFFFMFLIVFTVFSSIYYVFKYEGKYSLSYFTAYQNQAMTDLAIDYQKKNLETFKESGIEFLNAEIIPDGRVNHIVHISFLHNNVKKDISFVIGYFNYRSSLWLDFKKPENIRVHIPYIDNHIDKKHRYAKTIRQALHVMEGALHEHLNDEKYWGQVFHE